MFDLFDTEKLGELYEIVKGSVCPYLFPDEEFVHHSLSAYDETGGPAIEFGRDIESNKTLLFDAVILLSKLNPRTPRVSLADPRIDHRRRCCSTEFIAYKKRVAATNDQFYKYYFQSDQFRRRLKNVATGTTNSHVRVTPSETLSWKVPCPAEPEQSKIAEVLSTVDRTIAQTEALIAKQQRIKTGLMQDLLTRGIDEHGQLRSEATHRFKDSPLGRIPVEWEVRSLGEALAEAKGYLQTGPFGSQLHAHEYTHTGVPVIMPQDILQGFVSTAIIARVPELRANDLRRHRVLENDIVFSRRGDLTRAAAINSRETGWLCGTGCFLLRVPSTNMSAKWLAHLYRHHWIQRQIETNSVGSTMPSLNNGVMKQLIVPLPTADEQHQIAKQVDAIYAGIELLGRQLDKQRAIKTALMQDLLTGKVRVTPLLEPAEAATA